ncbi:hypothetical protein [Streptomyces sp. NPDC020917]|uniref:hypothetical protein n=1 Tax=Streptomyces sp. NPDC020917 TaxID=3365102 RepID=UPI00379A115A
MTTADEPEGTTDAAPADASEGAKADSTQSSVAATGSGQSGSALVFDDPLNRPSSDDTDRGWGESFSDSADDDFRRFLNEKPPHHL